MVTAHWWQLRGVADQQKLASLCGEDMLQQIAEEITFSKATPASVASDHARFINNEERTHVLVHGDLRARPSILLSSNAIDTPVNGARRYLRMRTQHFRRTTCGCQQHNGFARTTKDLDQSAHQGGFACTGISAKDQRGVRSIGREQSIEGINGPFLAARGCVPQGSTQSIGKAVDGRCMCGHRRLWKRMGDAEEQPDAG